MSAADIAIAGGHGQIALLLGELLVARGDSVLGLIRDPDQEADLQRRGIEPVVCDLEGEGDLGTAIRGAEAVVFAAGAGPGSGAERKRTMDLGGALRLIAACREEGVRRYVIVSAMGADRPLPDDESDFTAYLRAKTEADAALRDSGLAYTIVRPGGLTDDPPTGAVRIGDQLPSGKVPRADVAGVIAAVLGAEQAIGAEFDLLAGSTPIDEAIASL